MDVSDVKAHLLFPALPRLAVPCPALPCPALPCPSLPCPALPCKRRVTRRRDAHVFLQLFSRAGQCRLGLGLGLGLGPGLGAQRTGWQWKCPRQYTAGRYGDVSFSSMFTKFLSPECQSSQHANWITAFGSKLRQGGTGWGAQGRSPAANC